MKKRAQKVNHAEIKNMKNLNGRGNNFEGVLADEKKLRRIYATIDSNGMVSPRGLECHEFGFLIAQRFHHRSFINFKELMNDEDFLIAAAKITPNPVDCINYMYFWIDNRLKSKSEFRLKYLKQIFLNENVYKLKDIKLIVESCGFEHELKLLLADVEFMQEFKKRLEEVSNNTVLEFHCSGDDENELHDYKVQANNYRVLCDNIKNGLTEILKSFTCFVEEDKEEKETEKEIQEYVNKELNFWGNFKPLIRHEYY